MTDILERLRSATRDVVTGEPLHPEAWPDLYITDIIEAVDEIERLRACAEESERDVLRARAEKLEIALIKEREERFWLAYEAGSERDGKWTHNFMSDGEWLIRECGFDPASGWYDAATIKATIPTAALNVLNGAKE